MSPQVIYFKGLRDDKEIKVPLMIRDISTPSSILPSAEEKEAIKQRWPQTTNNLYMMYEGTEYNLDVPTNSYRNWQLHCFIKDANYKELQANERNRQRDIRQIRMEEIYRHIFPIVMLAIATFGICLAFVKYFLK